MPANRHSKLFAVLLMAGALLAFGACKDKGQGADSPSAKGQFAHLPKDSNLVVGVYPQQLASSALFQEHVGPKLGENADFKKLKEACGFDPMTAISGIVVGGNTDRNDGVVVTVSGITKEQFVKCVPAMSSESAEQVTVTEEGDYVKVESRGEATWFGWVDSKTMVMRSEAKDKASIEAIVKSTDGLDKNENMMKLVGQVDGKAGVWFAVHNDKPDQPLAGVPVQAKALYGSVNVTQGLAFHFTIQQGSPEEAQKTVTDMTQQLVMVKQMMPYLAKLELKAEGSDVHVTLDLNNDEVKELAPMIEQQLGGMMPMMGAGHPPMGEDPGMADEAAGDPGADEAAGDPGADEAAEPEGE